MRISDWSSDVCSSDLETPAIAVAVGLVRDHVARRSSAADVDETLEIRRGRDLELARQRHPDRQIDRPRRDEAMLAHPARPRDRIIVRSEEHTSELQSLMRISYAVFCLKKKKHHNIL